jgi:hypothetical protein
MHIDALGLEQSVLIHVYLFFCSHFKNIGRDNVTVFPVDIQQNGESLMRTNVSWQARVLCCLTTHVYLEIMTVNTDILS